MLEIAQSAFPCAVCGFSPAWDFGNGPRCPEHYGEAVVPKRVGLLKGPSGVLNIGSGEVQGSRDNPSRKARNRPEQDFQDRVIALLQLKGFRVHAERHARTAKGWTVPIQGTPGFPDIIAIRVTMDGWISKALSWELKAKGGKPSPDQLEWLRLFELAGFDARVWHEDQEDDLIKLVESWR